MAGPEPGQWRRARLSRGAGFEKSGSYIEVDSFEDAMKLVTCGGGTVLMEKSMISDTDWFAVFADPDGNHICLHEGATDA